MNVSTQQGLSRRRFLQMTGLTATAALLAACPAPAGAPAGGGESSTAPGTERLHMEAWSRATDVGQESMMGIIDNYNAQNDDVEVEFVFIPQTQGSQADEVTVLLPPQESRLLTRELFYTAVTRAKTKVRVVGPESAVRAAIERRARRASGLARRLSGLR